VIPRATEPPTITWQENVFATLLLVGILAGVVFLGWIGAPPQLLGIALGLLVVSAARG